MVYFECCREILSFITRFNLSFDKVHKNKQMRQMKFTLYSIVKLYKSYRVVKLGIFPLSSDFWEKNGLREI